MIKGKLTILWTGPPADDKRVAPYKNAIEESGGSLLVVPVSANKDLIDELIGAANGILLPGGTDVNPSLYGQEVKPYSHGINDQRDALEIRVLKRAIEKGIPTLAICRGVQILNVCLGGTLYQDVKKEMKGGIHHDYHEDSDGNELSRTRISHPVAIADDSLLRSILGAEEIGVNSLHHQGINRLGKHLIASAVAPDGLIEAVEMKGHPFLLGVQWHPEGLYSDLVWKHLFDIFIKRSRIKQLSDKVSEKWHFIN